jgi:hypothetical protein
VRVTAQTDAPFDRQNIGTCLFFLVVALTASALIVLILLIAQLPPKGALWRACQKATASEAQRVHRSAAAGMRESGQGLGGPSGPNIENANLTFARPYQKLVGLLRVPCTSPSRMLKAK